MDVVFIRDNVVVPVLRVLNLNAGVSEEMMMGTGAQESRFIYLEQIGGGPAKSWWEMETATHDDTWVNFLNFRPVLAAAVNSLRFDTRTKANASELITNPWYACAMARVRYYRVEAPLPLDRSGIAGYYKDYYNTATGAATTQEFVNTFNEMLSPKLYAPLSI